VPPRHRGSLWATEPGAARSWTWFGSASRWAVRDLATHPPNEGRFDDLGCIQQCFKPEVRLAEEVSHSGKALTKISTSYTYFPPRPTVAALAPPISTVQAAKFSSWH
jgi:hypothetical protein